MNTIRQIQALNKREIENGVTPEGSWHRDYTSAYVHIGGLPFELSEGDIVTIFSQYGEPVHVNLVRDKETGKSRGFAFLKYEDQRSTDLAVDNLGGATIMGRMLKVDHTDYKRKDDEEIRDNTEDFVGEKKGEDGDGEGRRKRRRTDESAAESEEEEARPMLKEERELAELMRNHDDDDPMKEYLIKEKRQEVDEAVARLTKDRKKQKDKEKRSERKEGHHRHHRHHHRERPKDESAERDDSKDRRRRRSSHSRGGAERDDRGRGSREERHHKEHRRRRDRSYDSR
ncbi:MAG: hypothetical protein M4579_007437 [Chaenotheca gracillima]|nr:MAG: hypothetical protein M4579_007437 [Chaenotheca gracillima]